MSKLPDFIIIGAMKCATTTLHEQLACQPGIFMTHPKEPFFFSNDEVWAKGIGWYKRLFEDAHNDDLCGESSTHYTKLPTYPKTIKRMHEYLPDVKLIYIIRHPIDRLISHYIHDWSEKKINVPIDEAISFHIDLIEYGKYAMQLQPFLEAYGPDNILLIFFERLVAHSQTELERVARFIGYQDRPHWRTVERANVSAKRLRRSPLRDAIVWNPLLTWFRRRYIPQSLRDRVKRIWQMRERPELTHQILAELEYIFDEDLAQLSEWTGTNLSCKTFKYIAQSSIPTWSVGPITNYSDSVASG